MTERTRALIIETRLEMSKVALSKIEDEMNWLYQDQKDFIKRMISDNDILSKHTITGCLRVADGYIENNLRKMEEIWKRIR